MPRGGQWVFVVLAGIVGAFYGASTTTTNQLVSDSWMGVKNTWAGAGFAAFLAALFFWNQNRKVLPPVAAMAVLRIAKRRQARELAKAWQRAAAPWSALQSFVVTDSQRYLGAASQTQGGRRIEPESVLLADFGSVASSIVVSRAMTTEEAAAEWHRLFGRFFIDGRAEHLRQAKTEALQAKQGAGAERPSAI